MLVKILRPLVFVILAIVRAEIHDDPALNQIVIFKEKTQVPIAIMTTSAGEPIDYKMTSTLNERLLFNEYFLELITHMNRQKIPPRVVHAKAGGAFGFFEVTHDVTDICKATFLNEVGKKTRVAVRFSPVATDRGGMDLGRESIGFAVKFYTEEGNFDIVGLNSPTFPIKDPIFFPTFARAQQRNPATNLNDPNMLWDFLTLRPESWNTFLMVFGDRGIPDGYQNMPGYGIHTFQVVNKHGESYFIRFFFEPDGGTRFLRSEEARKIASVDQDYNTRKLYRAIGEGNYPSWTAYIQVLTPNDVKEAGFDVFDVTKRLPVEKYPLKPLGRMVLNENPNNYFADIEQLAFCPANLVPGILGAPDKLFESRRLSYRDSQYYRLGANFNKIAVNCPLQTMAFTYNRDGRPPVKDNMKGVPNYYPNSFNGPVPYKEINGAKLIEIYEHEANNFEQARELYIHEMSPEERTTVVENILYSLGPVTHFIQERAVKLLTLIHPDLGERVWAGLQANRTYINY